MDEYNIICGIDRVQKTFNVDVGTAFVMMIVNLLATLCITVYLPFSDEYYLLPTPYLFIVFIFLTIITLFQLYTLVLTIKMMWKVRHRLSDRARIFEVDDL
jgi:magnesium-transporting ATPase (P-type)